MMKNLILIIACCCWWQVSIGQELLNKKFTNPAIEEVVLSNVFGGISIEGHSGDEIEVQVILKKGELPAGLGIDYKQADNYLLVYLKTPCSHIKENLKFDPKNPLNVGQWRNNCNWNQEENFDMPNLQFIVKVPSRVNTYASTVMDGNVEINNISGKVVANNINGNIKVRYNLDPMEKANFYTINGDINIDIPNQINATTSFKTMNGDFYTNLKDLTILPQNLEKESNNNNGFKFKIDSRRRMQFGKGGVQLDFETINGDAYLTSNK